MTDVPHIDLGKLEKECLTFTNKASKRIKSKGYTNSQKDNFVDKIIRWHQQRKEEKVKRLFEHLFPKLKDGEEEIRLWLTSVLEKREIVWNTGIVMLEELKIQVDLYQTHLDFLDEAINDVRQLDFDIVREVSELIVAYEFNEVCMYQV